MNSTDFIDKSYDVALSSQYDLSILLGMDRFFYAINNSDRKVLLIKKLDIPKEQDRINRVKSLLLSDEAFQKSFAHTNVCYSSSFFTLIPSPLLDPKETRTYLEKVCNLPDSCLAFKSAENPHGMSNVYGINDDDFYLLNSFFPNAKHVHLTSVLLDAYRSHALNQIGERMYINIQSHEMCVYLFRNGELNFANFFKFKSSEDFLYYVMLCFEQQRLDQEQTQLFLTGKLIKDSKVFQLLRRYVRNVKFLNSEVPLNTTSSQDEWLLYQYFDLLSLRSCAL